MTAAKVRILGSVGAALLLASCSGPLFSKVEIKAAPTVYAALGTAKGQVSDYISVAKIRELLKSSPEVKVFDYQDPADTTQKFLVSYPMKGATIDFGKYLKDLKLDSTLSQALTPGTFTIPSLNQTVSQSGSFNLNATLRTQVNTAFATLSPSTTFVETGSGSTITPPAGTLPDVPITLTTFDTATFSAGSLELAFTMPAASGSLILTAQIALVNGNTVLAQTSTPVDVKSGTAVIPLAGVTLPKTFQIRFNASTSGGSAGTTPTINVVPSLSGDIALSSATGLNLPSTSVTITSMDIPVNGSNKFDSATIGTGTITINLTPLWTGFTRSTDLTITQVGNATPLANVVGNTTNTIVIDLVNKTLNDGNITVAATTSVAASNGSLTGLSGGSVSLGATSVVDISLFNTIRVRPGTDFKPKQTFNETLSQQLLDWVDSIHFNKVGIEFEITNGLPLNNPMTIDLKSLAFQLPGGTPTTLPSNQTAPTSTLAGFTKTDLTFTPATVSNQTLDFEVTLSFPGYVDGGTLDLNNIVPGTSLSVTGKVNLVAEWDTAVIKPKAGGGVTGTFPTDGSKIDLSQLKTYLGTGINFGQIDAYLYLTGLDTTTNPSMATQVLATYTDTGVLTTKILAGANALPGGTESLPMVATSPNTAFPTNPDDPITSTWTLSASKPFTIEDILNAKPNDLQFTYELNIGTLTVTNDVNQPPREILPTLVIILPMALKATGATVAPLGIDNPLPADDLFGRKAGGNNKDINDLLSKLVSMELNLAVTNKTGLQLSAHLTKGTFVKDLILPATSGPVALLLTRSDIQYIRDTIPFDLALTVDIPATPTGTTYNMQRGGSINATITVNAATDIDQTFDLRGTN